MDVSRGAFSSNFNAVISVGSFPMSLQFDWVEQSEYLCAFYDLNVGDGSVPHV